MGFLFSPSDHADPKGYPGTSTKEGRTTGYGRTDRPTNGHTLVMSRSVTINIKQLRNILDFFLFEDLVLVEKGPLFLYKKSEKNKDPRRNHR